MVTDSESSNSEDELDSPHKKAGSGDDGEVTQGTSNFYPGYRDLSSETDVRFHITKRKYFKYIYQLPFPTFMR